MISKEKRRSEAGEREESPTREEATVFRRRMSESRGLRTPTPIISESRTKSVESPAPRPVCGDKALGSGRHVGVGRVIKYLHARDACMRDDVSNATPHACGASSGGGSNLGGVLAKSFFRVFTYVAFALFAALSVMSLGTLMESRYSKLMEISELISSVSIPSVEDIYYFSKESRESVREAFNYLGGGGEVAGSGVGSDRRGRQVPEEDYSALSIERYDPLEAMAGVSLDKEKRGRELEEALSQPQLTRLVEILLEQGQAGGGEHLDGTSLSMLELLCYKDFGSQEGMLEMYYREKEGGVSASFGEYLGEFDQETNGAQLINKLALRDGEKNKRVLDLLGLERPYELYVSSRADLEELGSQFPGGERSWQFRVSRRVVVSSGYGNEEIRCFCEVEGRWVCSKYEMLVLRLLLEYYRGRGETFVSFFLWHFKARIVDRGLLDNIPFFAEAQRRLVGRLFPGLLESFQSLTRGVYAKIDGYERRRGRKALSSREQRYYLEKVTEEDVNWVISLVLSHSIQDRNGNVAFVPYFGIIPPSSERTGSQTVLHHPGESSFDWRFSRETVDDGSRRERGRRYLRIRSFYGHLNNIKSIVQYGRLLDKNEYTTVWFIRRDDRENKANGFRLLHGTNTVLSNMDSLAYKEHLPDWLLGLSGPGSKQIRVDARGEGGRGGGQFVHFISKTRTVPIPKSAQEAKLKHIECNERTFYNGVGLGFGTIQFSRSSLVGGIRGSVYVCLREIIPLQSSDKGSEQEDKRERREEVLARIMHDNCKRRLAELRDARDLLVGRLSPRLGKEYLAKLPSRAKQEIRIDVKLLYATLEELKSMRECVTYFGKLLQMITDAK